MAKFLLEKYLAHIYMTAERIKRQYICEVKKLQVNNQVPHPVVDTARSLRESFMVYISPCTVGTHKANTNTIFAENQSLSRLSATFKIHGLISLHTAGFFLV